MLRIATPRHATASIGINRFRQLQSSGVDGIGRHADGSLKAAGWRLVADDLDPHALFAFLVRDSMFPATVLPASDVV